MIDDAHDREDREGKGVDYAPLDPWRDSAAWEGFVRRIRTAATPELLRRQAAQSWGGVIVLWRRPILALSGLLAVVSIALLLTTGKPRSTTGTPLTEALGLSGSWAAWVGTGEQPSADELLGSKEGTR
jgi:hypothetical protein